MLAVDVLEYEEASEDASINHDGAASDEEYGSGLVGAGVTEEVGDMQKAVKYSYLLSYMLKPSQLLAQGFKNNRTAQKNIFKKMSNIGPGAEWTEGRIVVSYYLDIDTTKDQCYLINPTPLE